MLAAPEGCRRVRISYWESIMVEATRALSCDTVLSEDLSHGQSFNGVRVVNPFRNL